MVTGCMVGFHSVMVNYNETISRLTSVLHSTYLMLIFNRKAGTDVRVRTEKLAEDLTCSILRQQRCIGSVDHFLGNAALVSHELCEK